MTSLNTACWGERAGGERERERKREIERGSLRERESGREGERDVHMRVISEMGGPIATSMNFA